MTLSAYLQLRTVVADDQHVNLVELYSIKLNGVDSLTVKRCTGMTALFERPPQKCRRNKPC